MPGKAEISIPIALATSTVAIALYQRGLPSSADIRVGVPGDETIETVRKQNAWLAAGTVSIVSLLTKDPTVFIIGGLTVVAMDVFTRANNWASPVTNKIEDTFSYMSQDPTPEPEAAGYASLMAVP